TFIAFFPSLKNGFVNWDDKPYVVESAVIRDLSFRNIAHLFNIHTSIMANYHPLTMISYCLDYHFFKLNPLPYHLDNILLHLLNTWLVFIFIYRLAELRFANQKPFLIAAISALLF